jgi:hypothetical protein
MKMTRMIMVFIGITLGMGCLCIATERGHYSATGIDNIAIAIDFYWGAHRGEKYPASLDELVQFASTNKYLKDHPVLKVHLLNTWGEPFAYETDGRHWYILQSSGRDKTMWTADDVFRGNRSVRLDEAIEKAKQTPAVTNAVQATTPPSFFKRWFGKPDGAVSPPSREAKAGRTKPSPTNRADDEANKDKAIPWKLPLLIGAFTVSGILYFLRRKLKTRS